MEFLSRTFHGLVHRLLPPRQSQITPEISRMDAYLNAIYKVLIWDKPKSSCMTLGALLVLFWLIVQLELRFYGVIFILILVVLLCDLYFERNDLKEERGEASDTMRQVANVCTDVIVYLKVLRKDNPPLFCFSMCGLFLSLTVLARNVSGLALAYLMLIALFSGPFLISKIPQEYLTNFKKVVQTFGTTEGVLAESELLPYLTNKDFNERDPDLDSLLTDKTADSVTNSLISGITSMPSHLDGEGGSLDGLEEEDLEFPLKSTTQTSAVSYTPGEYSSDSDSEHKSMNFECSHFNRDSSSEDENYYAKGLKFSEEVSRDLTDNKIQNRTNLTAVSEGHSGNVDSSILENLASLGSHLISNLLTKTAAQTVAVAPKRKDSDSDFEIIDSKEIDDES